MRSGVVIGLVLAMGVAFLGSPSAAGAQSTGADYRAPGPTAPVIVTGGGAGGSTSSSGSGDGGGARLASQSQPAAASIFGVPSSRDVISVRGDYAGANARELYCITWSRGC